MHQLETDRLQLRQFRYEDVDRAADIFSNPHVMRYVSSGVQTKEQTKTRIELFLKGWEERGFGIWAIVHKQTDQLMGRGGLVYLDGTPEVELGYLLDQPYWNQGFATEFSCAALRFGFEQINLDRIVAIAQPANIASQRVMQKVGMTFEKTAHYYKTDVVYYAISKHEFYKLHG